MSYSRLSDPLHEIGLRDVVRDGLNIIHNGSQVEPARREFVFRDLADLFRTASEGAGLYNNSAQCFVERNIKSYHAYKWINQLFLLNYYLYDGEIDYLSNLDRLEESFVDLAQGQALDEHRKKLVSEVLDLLADYLNQGSMVALEEEMFDD